FEVRSAAAVPSSRATPCPGGPMKRSARRAPKPPLVNRDPHMSAAADPLGQLNGGPGKLSSLCLDPKKPPEVRAKILLDRLHGNEEPTVQQALLTDLLRQTGAAPGADAVRLQEAYQQGLAELANGAVRPATFLAAAEGDLPGPGPRAHVVTPDGQERFPTL